MRNLALSEKTSSLHPHVKSTGPGNAVCRRKRAGEGNVLLLGDEAFFKLVFSGDQQIHEDQECPSFTSSIVHTHEKYF